MDKSVVPRNTRSSKDPNEQQGGSHWRAKALRGRVEARRRQRDEPHEVLLEAGKQQVRERQWERELTKGFTEGVQEFDGETELAIANQNQMQAVMLYRSEQSWDVNKQLRSIQNTVRRAAEGKKESSLTLDVLEQKILNLREMTTADINNDQDKTLSEEDKIADMALQGIRSQKRGNKMYADAEVDAELAFILTHGSSNEIQHCPNCNRLLLQEFMERHVQECKKVKEPFQESKEEILAVQAVKPEVLSLQRQQSEVALQDYHKRLERKQSSYLSITQTCPECGKQILASRMAHHRMKCEELQKSLLALKKQKERVEQHRAEAEELSHLAPLPPQNLRLITVGPDFIEIAWDPPIFQGGYKLYVHDYSIEFAKCKRSRVGKKETVTLEQQRTQTTSQFCLVNPVCPNHFIIDNLVADTEYVNIKVRAINKVGPSEPSDEIESITTDHMRPPAPPEQLMLAKATSGMLTFVWSAPKHCGGSATGILYYELEYTMFVHKSLDSGQVLTTLTSKIDAPCQCYVLDGLEGDFEVKDISVLSVTEGFVNGVKTILRSKKSNVIPRVRTLEPTREEMLQKEIRRISVVDDKFVDSKVYNGFKQRYSRVDLMRRLTSDLNNLNQVVKRKTKDGKVMTIKRGKANEQTKVFEAFPQQLLFEGFNFRARKMSITGLERKHRKNLDRNRATMVEANKAVQMDEVPRRRSQFHYRMQRLETELKQLEAQKGELVMQRAKRTKELEHDEERVTILLAGLDRVNAHTGEFIDSSLIHDRVQRFHTWSLKIALEDEIKFLKSRLATGKRLQVKVNNDLEKNNKITERKQALLKDRMAALAAFEKEIEKKKQALDKVRHWRLKNVFEYFHQWADYVGQIREVKKASMKFVKRMQNLELYKGFNKWVEFMKLLEQQEMDKEGITGRGTYLLAHCLDERMEVKGGAAELLYKIRSCQIDLQEAKKTTGQKQAIRESPFYDASMEEKMESVRQDFGQYAHKLLTLQQARTYLSLGKYSIALDYFRAYAEQLAGKVQQNATVAQKRRRAAFQMTEEEKRNAELNEGKDLRELTECYYGMATSLQKLNRIDRALVDFDRTRSLAIECSWERMHGLAYIGIAQCNRLNSFYKVAIEYADRALKKFEDLNDRQGEAQACRELEFAYAGIHDEERCEMFRERALKLENELENKIADTFESITEAERKLISITSDRSQEMTLEVVSAKVPELRRRIEEKRKAAETILAEATKHEKANVIDRERLVVVKKQIELVKKCKEDELDSDLVHGIMQRFQVKQLLANLLEEDKRLEEVIQIREAEKRKAEIRASNVTDDMQGLEETLQVELGPLMRKIILGTQRFRCASLNPVNLRSRDVSGCSTGGVERTIMCIKDCVYLFDLRDGALLAILDGSSKQLNLRKLLHDREHYGHEKHPIPGHHGHITACYYFDQVIVTGGVDKYIRIWKDHDEFECTHILHGHTGTIWSLFCDGTKIVSGSSDQTVRVWNMRSGECVRIMHNVHRRCVKALDCDMNALATGGPDYEVRYWPYALDFSNKKLKPKHRMQRFIGHDCPVTTVLLNATELISGGEDGRIFVWDIVSGNVVTICEGHTSCIRSLQVDATKIVSCSIDKTIAVFDFATGTKLLTLRGHEDSILDVQFDQYRILSLSSDGKLRFWYWSGDKQQPIPSHDKLHIYEPSDSLQSLSEKYKVTVQQILQWNNIQDPQKTMYVGMRLVVRKANLSTSDDEKS